MEGNSIYPFNNSVIERESTEVKRARAANFSTYENTLKIDMVPR